MSTSVATTTLERPRQLLAAAFVASALVYVHWRITTFNAAAPWLSGLLLAAECLGLAGLLAQLAITWRISQRSAPPLAQPLPVDVWLLADGHAPDVLRKALRSALGLHGPHTVSVLTQQAPGSAEHASLVTLTAALGCRLVSGNGPAHGSAHGPANGAADASALARLANLALTGSDAPLIAWLDGDQALRRDFLSQTQGHFHDPRVAYVQTAPAVPGEGPAAAATGAARRGRWTWLFAPVLPLRGHQRGWDRWQATVWAGNGAVLRRSAIQSAGGFAAGPDLQASTSVRLQAAGDHGVWHDERLCFSLAPEADAAQARPASARQAWSVLLRERVLTRPGLSGAQRLHHLARALAATAPLPTGAWRLLPALALASGVAPIDTAAPGWATDLALHGLPVALLGAWLQAELSRGELRWAGLRAHQLARLGKPAQTALLGVNVLAVLGGGAIAWADAGATAPGLSAPGLPAAAAWALTAWAALNAAALVAALQAAVRTEGRDRTRQRFTVTLAAELANATGERVQGTVDDLSEAGLRFYGSLLPSMAQSQVLQGTLHLPDGPLPFTGEVRHLGASGNDSMHQPRSVGLSLQLDPAAKARVEAFLFSSDLQWRLQGHTEVAPTPLSRLLPAMLPPPPPALARRHWNGAQLRLHILAEATPVLCSAADAGAGIGTDMVVSHSPLPEQQALILDVFRRMAAPSRGVKLVRLADESGAAAGATALYTYRVEPAPMPIVPMEYQMLASPFILVDDEPLLLQPARVLEPA